jgi:superfamily I DNA and/or RNA helicase
MAKVVRFDISLLERLYSQPDIPGMVKTMLDVQYRSPKELNAFPSKEFYEGRLKTSDERSTESLNALKESSFPWPIRDGFIIPTVFIQCSSEEDMGDRSKSNEGQVDVVRHVLKLLTTPKNPPEEEDKESEMKKVTVLSPYTKQIQALRRRLPSSITSSTIDSFQGRESDIIIFSTVRCNVDGDVGFLDDPRRLNVMWTRARLALIIVGDRATLSSNQLWKRALEACTEVVIVLEAPTTAG